VDFAILMAMWSLTVIASVRSTGLPGQVIFITLNVLLVLRKPSNAVLALILQQYTPMFALLIPRNFIISFGIACLAAIVHGRIFGFGRIFRNMTFVFGILFTIWAGITLFFAPDIPVALAYFRPYIDSLLLIFVVSLLIADLDELGRVLKWWAIVAGFSLFISTLHFLIGDNTFAYDFQTAVYQSGFAKTGRLIADVGTLYVRRVMWPGIESNYHSTNLLFPLGIALSFTALSQPHRRPFWLVVALAIVASILGTFSRSGFIMMVAVLVLFALRKNVKALLPVGVLAAIGYLIIRMIPALAGRILGIGETTRAGATGRFVLWQRGFAMWGSSPVWGAGIGAFYTVYNTVVHNTYLQALVDLGIVGAILYTLVPFYSLLCYLRMGQLRISLNDTDCDFGKTVFAGLAGMCMMIGTLSYENAQIFWLACFCFTALYRFLEQRLYYWEPTDYQYTPLTE